MTVLGDEKNKNQTIGRRDAEAQRKSFSREKRSIGVLLIFSAPLRLCGERFYSF